MESCDHENCPREQYVWFPTGNIRYAEIQKHPFCKHCGTLKNISDDQGKKLGYWMNILARMQHEFPLTRVQHRLISQALTDHEDFLDLYGISLDSQKEIFIKTITSYSKCSKNELTNWLE